MEPTVAPAPTPKRPRVLKEQGSFTEYEALMERVTSSRDEAAPAALAAHTLKEQIEEQWETFFALPNVPLLTDPFEWWRSQKTKDFGLLFPVVRRFMAVPASNAGVERFFDLQAVVQRIEVRHGGGDDREVVAVVFEHGALGDVATTS